MCPRSQSQLLSSIERAAPSWPALVIVLHQRGQPDRSTCTHSCLKARVQLMSRRVAGRETHLQARLLIDSLNWLQPQLSLSNNALSKLFVVTTITTITTTITQHAIPMAGSRMVLPWQSASSEIKVDSAWWPIPMIWSNARAVAWSCVPKFGSNLKSHLKSHSLPHPEQLTGSVAVSLVTRRSVKL